MKFPILYQFTTLGMQKFEAVFRGEISSGSLDPIDSAIATSIAGSKGFEAKEFQTTKEMASSVLASLGSNSVQDVLHNRALWAWLTFVLRDNLFKKNPNGSLKHGAYEVWMPSDPNNYQKAQRHKVRMPVQLFDQFGDDADHALCGRPDTPGEVREQCTSQQSMFTRDFQKLCRHLYYDSAKKKITSGAGGKGAGASRRLPQVSNQFQVTWDIHSFSVDDWIDKLPQEFDKFKGNSDA